MSEDGQLEDFTGLNVRTLRAAAGLSRQQLLALLARNYGVSMHATTLRRIEAEEQQPKAVEAAALARFFQIDLDTFISRPVDPRVSEYYRTLNDLQALHERLLVTAKDVRVQRSEARLLLKNETSPEMRASEVSAHIQKYLNETQHQDELAETLIRGWSKANDSGQG